MGLAEADKLENSIERALNFLLRSQLPSGEFKSYRSTDPAMEVDCEFDSSPFPTSLITYSLSHSTSPIAGNMIDRALSFFLAEMESGSVWRYWTSQHKYHKNIPPDLDDTCYVSSVLVQNEVPFPDNRPLILANRNRQGLFYTWLVPRFSFPLSSSYWLVILREALKPVSLYYFWKLNESEPNDVDCVVNANVLYYLGERQETKQLIDYLIRIIEENSEDCCDKWHLNPFMFYYCLSRCYFNGIEALTAVKNEIIDRIRNLVSSDGKIGDTILDTALAICTLQNFNSFSAEFKNSLDLLQEEQNQGGEWNRIPLYWGGPKKYFGWGSEELTTGFCLEALIRSSNE